jgi:TorA maturation chaperone TorD
MTSTTSAVPSDTLGTYLECDPNLLENSSTKKTEKTAAEKIITKYI